LAADFAGNLVDLADNVIEGLAGVLVRPLVGELEGNTRGK
jgi:hypothetical protein